MGWLVARTDMPLRRTVRALVTASFVTPPFLGAIAWELLAAPNSGLLNKLYRALTGAPQDEPLFNIYSLGGLIFVISCYTFPYVFVLVANALDRIPGDLEDASSILGGRAWTTARRITIPLAMPALLAGALVAFLQAMTLFGSPAILALPAGFHTMTTKIWSLFQYPPKPELAAAASLPLLVLTVLLLRAEHMILGRRGYSVVGGKQGDPRLIQLGRLKWVALAVVLRACCCARCSCPMARCSTPRSRRSRRNSLRFSNVTLHNINFVFFELSATKLACQEHLHARHRCRRPSARVIALVIGYVTTRKRDRRLPRARLPRHRADRDSRHRAGRRAVPELYAAAVRALRHAVDPADRLRDHRAAGRLPADAVGVPRRASGPGGCQPHPRRHAPAGAAPHHRAAAAHQRDRHLVLHLRRRDPRTLRRHHPVHLGDQGDLGADLRPQRVRRSRRHLGARPDHADDHLRGRHRGQPHPRLRRRAVCATPDERRIHDADFPKLPSPNIWRSASWRSMPAQLPPAVRQNAIDLLVDVVGLCVTARNEDYVKAALAAWDDDGPCTAIGHARTHERGRRRLRQRHGGAWRGFRRHLRRRAGACRRSDRAGGARRLRAAQSGRPRGAARHRGRRRGHVPAEHWWRRRRRTRPASIRPPSSARWGRPPASAPRSG